MSESSSPIGFVAPEPSELAPLFPGYEIHDLIATGGMGAVYRAVQKSLDRTVALKILPLEFSADAAFCAGFEAEAKAMARLNHPNLIGVYDFGTVNGMLYIVMEFVPGKSIYHSAYGVAIDPPEVIRLVTAICNGLSHAHENGILHRDIKPSNILLTLNAEPKIGDFGLAQPIGRKTEEGEEIFGTPGYTAPEVIEAPQTVDHRADLFSVGVLLHELLTGKLPADDPRPASVISGCDPRFDIIVLRATNPLAAHRHSSAAEIAAELQQITTAGVTGPLANMPAVPRAGATGPPQPRRTKSPAVRRKPLNLAWIGPLLAVSIMAFCWYKFIHMKPRVVVIQDPAAKSSPAGSSRRDLDSEEKPDESQTPPPISNAPGLADADGKAANENPKAARQNQRSSVDYPGDWDNRDTGWRIRIKAGGVAICYFYKDRDKSELVNQVDSSWKQGAETNQIIIHWEKNPRYHNTCTMGDSGDFFESINQRGQTTHYSRVAKTETPEVLAQPGKGGPASVGELEALHTAGLAKARQPLAALQEKQREILKKFESEAKAASDYKFLLAVRTAIAAIPDRDAGRTVMLSEDARVAKLEIAYVEVMKAAGAVSLRASAKIDQDYLASLNKLAVELTQAGQTENAVKARDAADRFASRLKEATAPNPPAGSSASAIWEKKAREEFPALNEPGSEFMKTFKALKERKDMLASSFFLDPQWPYLLAKETDLAMRQAVQDRNRHRIPAGAKSFNDRKYLVGRFKLLANI